jgi:hypothetical protein
MPLKDDAKSWTIKEQIIEDPLIDLTFQFEVAPDGTPRLRISGNLPIAGDRLIVFNAHGESHAPPR